jgi:hypothetical protein
MFIYYIYMNLPKELNYTDFPPHIGTVETIDIVNFPINGSSFTNGSQIQIEMSNRGFLVPDSMYLTYNYTFANTANCEYRGCPAVTTFNRLDTYAGSSIIDTIDEYALVYNVMANTTMDVAQKYGQGVSLGYNSNSSIASIEALDGRLLTENETGSFSFPFMNILSNSEKLIPLFLLPRIRHYLTLDTFSNLITSAQTGTSITLTNVQLCYKIIDFGPVVEKSIKDYFPKIFIKSQSFGVVSQPIASGSSGGLTLTFNQNYQSIKSILTTHSCSTTLGNGKFDSINLVANADYQYIINGKNYPQLPLSSAQKSRCFQELRGAVGSIFDKTNSMSINATEYNWGATDAATTYLIPGKFYVGTSLQKLNSESMFSGIPTNNTAINYKINLPSTTNSSSTVYMIANYDAILSIDTMLQQISVVK